MTTDQPPAPPIATDDDLVEHLLSRVGAHLSRGAPPEAHPVIIGGAIKAAILSERKRVVDYLNGQAHGAAAASTAARARGAAVESQKHQVAAAVAAGLARLVAQPPGPACKTCRGAKVVASAVVTAGGQPVARPCPDCAITETQTGAASAVRVLANGDAGRSAERGSRGTASPDHSGSNPPAAAPPPREITPEPAGLALVPPAPPGDG